LNKRKLLHRILLNSRNVRFGDMVLLVEAFGFRLIRTAGSHHMYTRDGIPKIVNLQEDNGQAKPYQIRQFLTLVEKYRLALEEE
jgi:predicted RNA binding protein YcfA (HicA-like mRNA interferase family)